MLRGAARAILAVVVLPHELAHALPARLAGLRVDITVLPEWDGPDVPIGRFDARLEPETPLWLIRLIALAPFPAFVGVAAVLGRLPLADPVSLALLPGLAVSATPSGGDIAVAANPRAARDAGGFTVPRSAWADRLTVGAVPFTTLLIAVLLVG